MKYIVGASIGGLFGFSLPMVVDIQNVNNEVPRIEDSQPVQEDLPVPIENAYTLPDDSCRYMNYNSEEIKEQAKECLDIEFPAIPAIQYVDIVNLEPGGVIIDHKTGEVGLLVRRYDIVEHIPLTLDLISDNEGGLYAWEILWSGTNADKNNRYFPYTETGLLNMIRVGTFEYVACIKK